MSYQPSSHRKPSLMPERRTSCAVRHQSGHLSKIACSFSGDMQLIYTQHSGLYSQPLSQPRKEAAYPEGLFSSPAPGFHRVMVIHHQATSSAVPAGRIIGRSQHSKRRKPYDSAASERFCQAACHEQRRRPWHSRYGTAPPLGGYNYCPLE